MKYLFRGIALMALLTHLLPQLSLAQTTITGVIFDGNSDYAIIGARIVVKNDPSFSGTITNLQGRFALQTEQPPPFTLVCSSIGYDGREIQIDRSGQDVIVRLNAESSDAGKVVARALPSDREVSAVSKSTEHILESPVSVSNLGVLDLQYSASQDYFHTADQLKEVQMNVSSLSLSSVNTRGFADIQNWRFIQYIDGMDMNAPGLNYSIGNFIGGSVIDLRNIEIVPGPASALYGPNAFNGILSMTTKDPFEYQGVALHVSAGRSVQDAGGSHPFASYGVRLAKSFKDKFGIKLNFSFQHAYEWEANDESYHITIEKIPFKDQLLGLPRTAPNFDAVNVYGDEVSVPIDLGNGTPVNINRTGFKERDLVDYNIDNFRINGSLHYKLTPDIDLSYQLRYVQGDAILRHTTIYPFVDVNLLLQKLELKGKNFLLRSYLSQEDAKNSYQMLATGAFIQQGLKADTLWGADYAKAFKGEVVGINPGDHSAARLYADRDIPNAESPEFQNLLQLTLQNPDVTTGGSKFIDQSTFVHTEGLYDLPEEIMGTKIQIGGSARRYNLKSQGKLFNDGPNGFNDPIGIWEYGAYIQGSRSFAEDRFIFKGSLRYDKNQNFEGRITPRLSGILALGEQRNHTFRISYQSGFRNPASQETYIALDVGRAIILGGTEDNINNYNYMLADGSSIKGTDIYNNLYTIPSVQAFLGSGGTDPALLVGQNLDFLKQERISAIEVGYKTQIQSRLSIDVNLFFNTYKNFVTRVNGFHLPTQRVFAIYTNINENINSFGASAGVQYDLKDNYVFWANYTFNRFDADNAMANNTGFLPGFNTPQNRFKIGLKNQDLWKGLGFNLNYRYTSAYLWQSPFGEGLIDSYGVMDGAIFYRIQPLNTLIKIGANNLLGNEYRTVYGGPLVGSLYYFSLIFDKYVN